MKYLSVIFAAMLLVSCYGEPISTSSTSNSEFKVELLFEHDGCKVYRFNDGGTRYFTTCQGEVAWKEHYGKTYVIRSNPTAIQDSISISK